MKIMITGGAGFVASYLIKECLKNGDEVIVTVRWNEDLHRIKEFKDKIKIEYVELTDLSSVINAIAKHKPEVISHLAAQSWVPYSMDNPIYTMKTNIESTLNVMLAIKMLKEVSLGLIAGIQEFYENDLSEFTYNPLIHICSSSEFYGKVDRKDLPITEEHKANPGNVYGVSKVAGDFLAQLYQKYYDLNILITRMFTHTGADRTMMSAENYYAREVAQRELDKKDVILIGDNEAMSSLRTWADVRDAVKNYRTLFEIKKTGIYNISGATTKTIQEVLSYLVKISNIDWNIHLKVDPKFSRAVNVDKQIVDITKYKNDCNWSNEISFEELMQSLLDFWRIKLQEAK